MKVRIKKLDPKAVIPQYSKAGDAGLDLTAISKTYDEFGNVCYGTGLAFEIPEDYVGLLFPRSSNAKKDLTLSNSVGVIDSGFRGEIGFKFKPSPIFNINRMYEEQLHNDYIIGDRVGQLLIIPYPQIQLIEAKELSLTERGTGSYGSSGK